MKIIANINSNILRPKHRFLYTKKNGEQGIYIVQNCTAIKGSDMTRFSNQESREQGIYKIGFRAKVVNRGGAVRSFYYNKVREMQKLSIFERAVT
jgi:hypothetical protein